MELICTSDNQCVDDRICLGKHCVAPSCGDGVLSGNEFCDDGNEDDGDCCGGDCTLEDGWSWDVDTAVCVSVCGDGHVTGIEQCDDENTNNGDCCDELCNLEPAWYWFEGRCEPSRLVLEEGIPTDFGDGTGVLPINVHREIDFEEAEHFDFTVTAGSAVADEQFFPYKGTLVFNAGEQISTLMIHLVSNGVHEVARTIRLSFTDIDGILIHYETISIPDLDDYQIFSMLSSKVVVTESRRITS
jgi:cysteine-rich repeat protein